jgi:formamidopyrimidine-DNA glycosylase
VPELPEVETVRVTLLPRVTGLRVDRVEIGDYSPVIARPGIDEFRRRIAGHTVTGLDRRGKFLVFRLDSGDSLTVHLRMTGELQLGPAGETRGSHFRLALICDGGCEIRFEDVRKFGRWSLLSPPEYDEFDRSLGPEPFDPALTAPMFHRMLSNRKRAIKALLLEQSFLAGVGNIYADEALFRAQINPHRPANTLSRAEAGRLLVAVRSILDAAISHRGTTLRNYRDGSGEPGGNLPNLRIYSLAPGDPCPTCGAPIVRDVVGQRGTRYCQVCQPLRRVRKRPGSGSSASRTG